MTLGVPIYGSTTMWEQWGNVQSLIAAFCYIKFEPMDMLVISNYLTKEVYILQLAQVTKQNVGCATVKEVTL